MLLVIPVTPHARAGLVYGYLLYSVAGIKSALNFQSIEHPLLSDVSWYVHLPHLPMGICVFDMTHAKHCLAVPCTPSPST